VLNLYYLLSEGSFQDTDETSGATCYTGLCEDLQCVRPHYGVGIRKFSSSYVILIASECF
jgi:hypothetical protein